MIIEVTIPSPGESITEVAIGSWLVEDKEYVDKDQEIAEVETDKATLPLIAPEAGRLTLRVKEGEKVQVGDVACTVDTSAKPERPKEDAKKMPANDTGIAIQKTTNAKMADSASERSDQKHSDQDTAFPKVKATPVARKLMAENHLEVDDIINGLKKITRHDVETILSVSRRTGKTGDIAMPDARNVTVKPMTPLRRKLSKRLVAVKNETAMLTTFNEVDMGMLLSLRKKYQQAFQEAHGIKLGLMSFFMKACALAIRDFPYANAMIEEENILIPEYVDISVAVQTEKGLMVPVVRNVNNLGLAEIELQISELAQKARKSKLSIEEMTGGTFTITNGGVFGSMLSTPILNPPQSAILGMHNIAERPVVRDGKIEARPVMYLALSYDHRLIDGKDSVSFLVRVKELIEDPLNLTGEDHVRTLLEL